MNIKKKYMSLLVLLSAVVLTACSGNGNSNVQTDEPSEIIIENGITTSLKEDANIKFDRMTDFVYEKVDTNDDDFEMLKTKYASQIPYIKYETTFSLTSVEMDMVGNYSGIYVFNNGEWQFSFGYITNSEAWEYNEKEASRVDKQRMLEDLKEQNFGTFEKGYVGDAKYSSIGSIDNREYDKAVHRDTITTEVKIQTDFAEYSIPVVFTYYFQKGIWELGGIEISDMENWELSYNNGNKPDYLTDNAIISYLTTDTNFLTYICNPDYIKDYKLTKESEAASKESVAVNYVFSANYQYIGTVDYNIELIYEWLNNEWSEPQPVPNVKGADFSEMLEREWKNDDNTSFKFTTTETEGDVVKLTGKYIVENTSTDIIANISVMLRDNNWDATITDINGNPIWDIPSLSFTLNLEYGAIVYNDKYYSPVEINIIDEEIPEEQAVTSNVLMYEHEDTAFKNEITRDNLMVNNISTQYSDGKFTLTGNVTNQSGGQSPYDIKIAMFDSDDRIIAEGGTSSGDSLLLTNSAAIFKIDVEDLLEEDHEKVEKIIIYIKAE